MIKINSEYNGRIDIHLFFKDQLVLEGRQDLLDELKAKGLFTGEKGSLCHWPYLDKGELRHLILAGLGSREGSFQEPLRMAVASAYKKACSLKENTAAFHLSKELIDGESLANIATAIVLGSYTFDKYLSKKKFTPLEEVFLLGEGLERQQGRIDEGILLGEMTCLSRDLANEPGDMISPEILAISAASLGESQGFKVEIFDEDEIEKLGMNAFLAVGRGSAYEPRLIVMEYIGNPGGETIGLVGKGITFDSGGLSIKPASSMLTMHGDMSGAASVIAAMGAIAGMKLAVNVTAVVAACENAVSGDSFRPNDILSSRSGKTIFISNTDAEGRLTLIDALDYILTEKKVDRVVDIATLTGAAEIALGQKIAAVVTNDDSFMADLRKSSAATGERVWELPHDEDFLKLIESPYADLNNSGGRYGGTITAGLFLGSVVGSTPWLHIDIAGPSWTEESEGYFSKGATGYGTRLLYRLVRDRQIAEEQTSK